jgi:hypothetical protein
MQSINQNYLLFGLSAVASYVVLTILEQTGIMHHASASTLKPCPDKSGKTVPCRCTTTNGVTLCIPVTLSSQLTLPPPSDPIKAPPPNLIFDAAHGGGGL